MFIIIPEKVSALKEVIFGESIVKKRRDGESDKCCEKSSSDKCLRTRKREGGGALEGN